VERVILPDSSILVDYLLQKTALLVERMFVYPERMRENLQLMQGLVFSGQILLDLTRKGVTREDAYQWVQRNAMRVWNREGDLKSLVLQDPDILQKMTPAEIETTFDLKHQLRWVDYVFQRVYGRTKTE
jgi:adenylosuccinate lyase